MKVLQIVDKDSTAIDNLAKFIQREDRNVDVLPFHPKRPDPVSVEFLRTQWKNYDLLHWQYWKSWKKAQELIPGIEEAKSILTHHNPYDLLEDYWLDYHDEVCVMNEEQRMELGYGTLIRHGVDTSLWNYQENDHMTIGICANRIESKKGVKQIAEVAKEMGLKFIVMGRISKPDYWKEVLKVGADIEFHENVDYKDMASVYHKMGVYVCNSVDGFETGPMPVFEALLCGVPVVSRDVGCVPELLTDKKSYISFDKDMRGAITEAFENRDTLRAEGWNVAHRLSSTRYAVEYLKLYNKVIYGGHPLVSVIVPLTRVERLPEIRKSVENQTYKNTEVIALVDDQPGYNLAKTRNQAIIKARGKYLLFLDDRLKLDSDTTIQSFLDQHNNSYNMFLWGDKGAGKKKFVENFSFTKRQDFIDAGMFNERIDKYGGMSQEIRTRLNRQGWRFKYCDDAKARETASSKNRSDKKADIIEMKDRLYRMGL